MNKESVAAKDALVAVLSELKGSLREAVDIRLWTREHPWVAVGTAVAAGFAAGAAVSSVVSSPSPDVRSEPRAEPAALPESQPTGTTRSARSSRTAILYPVLHGLFDLARVAVQTWMMAPREPDATGREPVEDAELHRG